MLVTLIGQSNRPLPNIPLSNGMFYLPYKPRDLQLAKVCVCGGGGHLWARDQGGDQRHDVQLEAGHWWRVLGSSPI